MSKPKTKRYLVVPGLGDPCPRCCQPTQIREHQEITAKHLRQPFYFARWFHCTNARCKVQMICPERYKVWNKHLSGETPIWSGGSPRIPLPASPAPQSGLGAFFRIGTLYTFDQLTAGCVSEFALFSIDAGKNMGRLATGGAHFWEATVTENIAQFIGLPVSQTAGLSQPDGELR